MIFDDLTEEEKQFMIGIMLKIKCKALQGIKMTLTVNSLSQQ